VGMDLINPTEVTDELMNFCSTGAVLRSCFSISLTLQRLPPVWTFLRHGADLSNSRGDSSTRFLQFSKPYNNARSKPTGFDPIRALWVIKHGSLFAERVVHCVTELVFLEFSCGGDELTETCAVSLSVSLGPAVARWRRWLSSYKARQKAIAARERTLYLRYRMRQGRIQNL
jgi:hypothetical protein